MKQIYFYFFILLGFSSYAQNDYSDCAKAFSVCKPDIYYFDNISGNGGQKESLKSNCDYVTLEETNSVWMKFKIKSDGIVTFLITPFEHDDDIDFILYKADNLDNLCTTKSDIRCMASGKNIGSDTDDSRCLGVTGLDSRSIDNVELNGCKFSDDNFLKFLDAKKGETYVLFVNNYASHNGFSILFDGTADFEYLDDCLDDKNQLSMQILNVYPNPSKDIINLSILSKSDEEVNINILNIEGKEVNSFKKTIIKGNQSLSFNVAHLPSGNYFVKIENENVHLIDKFVKE